MLPAFPRLPIACVAELVAEVSEAVAAVCAAAAGRFPAGESALPSPNA